MPSKRALILRIVALVVFFEFLATIPHAFAADKEKVLYSFGSRRGGDGAYPWAALILDAAGNLFGSAEYGGAYGDGMVFQLTPDANGAWTEKVLHSFSGKDGMYPLASLVFDASGNLYGTTENGGSGCGCGTVFELTPAANGRWTEKVLHSFSGKDGMYPVASLTLDADGNLYGTASQGGSGNWGTVFQLTSSAGGKWTYRVLHRFNGDDGAGPDSGLIFDAVGNLYGTTYGGGVGQCDRTLACGTVFQLAPGTGSKWTEKVLHSFNGFGQDAGEGAYPSGSVIFDATGNLYGTTEGGGSALCGDLGGSGCGTVFQLTREANGKWVERALHSFDEEDGAFPSGGLIRDKRGNLYGTTVRGGYSDGGPGTVFQVAPGANGSWTETVLYVFCSVNDCTDGFLPRAGVISDSAGNLYGTTSDGGTSSGTVFEITSQGAAHAQ